VKTAETGERLAEGAIERRVRLLSEKGRQFAVVELDPPMTRAVGIVESPSWFALRCQDKDA
jgi:hypothetical protein